MNITSKLVRITSAAVAVMAGFLLLLGPIVPGVKEAAAAINPAQSQNCAVHYYAFDEGKETSGAFGPGASFDPNAPDMTSLLAQLKERRECDTDGLYDPALVAAQYTVTANATLPDGVTPANLTLQKVSYADMTHFGDMLASNYDLYKTIVAELAHLESTATPSIEGVSKGQNSLYMTPNGNGGVLIKQGLVANDGHNLVFTYGNGATVKYRLECGFQPNWPSPIPNIPECVGEECSPPPYYPPTPPTPPTPEEPKPKNIEEAPQRQGNLPEQQMPNPLPAEPEHYQPSEPVNPPDVYVPPAEEPKPAPGGGGEPAPQPEPEPIVIPDPVAPAPAPSDPGQDTGCAPGRTSC